MQVGHSLDGTWGAPPKAKGASTSLQRRLPGAWCPEGTASLPRSLWGCEVWGYADGIQGGELQETRRILVLRPGSWCCGRIYGPAEAPRALVGATLLASMQDVSGLVVPGASLQHTVGCAPHTWTDL